MNYQRWIKLFLNKYLKGISVVAISAFGSFQSYSSADASPLACRELMQSMQVIQPLDLIKEMDDIALRDERLATIRSLADQIGLRVWLIGGGAVSLADSARKDLEGRSRSSDFLRQNQDFDLMVSSIDSAVKVDNVIFKFESRLARRLPEFSKDRIHVVASEKILSKTSDFQIQNSDTYSVLAFEVTASGGARVRDLRNWDAGFASHQISQFLSRRIAYLESAKHFQSKRYQAGVNPEIVPAIRFLIKANQFDAAISEHDLQRIKRIVESFRFNPTEGSDFVDWLTEIAPKLILNARNPTHAWRRLKACGLAAKLEEINQLCNSGKVSYSLTNKRPFGTLFSQAPLEETTIGSGQGSTAQELTIGQVTYDVSDVVMLDSVVNSLLNGKPYFIQDADGGTSLRTSNTIEGGNKLSLELQLKPNAREGSDFKITSGGKVKLLNAQAVFLPLDKPAFHPRQYFKLIDDHVSLFTNHSSSPERMARSLDEIFKKYPEEANESADFIRSIIRTDNQSKHTAVLSSWFSTKTSVKFPDLLEQALFSKEYGWPLIIDSVNSNFAWLHELKSDDWQKILKQNEELYPQFSYPIRRLINYVKAVDGK